jgi:hypothetical protein
MSRWSMGETGDVADIVAEIVKSWSGCDEGMAVFVAVES